ncbi:DUF4159 domain-containing protein [Chloroflexota bacterium]
MGKMALIDILKFQLKRVNPFQGMMIDTDIWRDAHEYHRDQQRLHLLAFHSTGVIYDLNVTANNPPDRSINIQAGVAVDPEGNLIIVPEAQPYQIQSREKKTIHLIIQFREVPGGPYQPAEGGQPTRILEAYRIQERDKLPNEPYLELARIDFDPENEAIRDAKNPSQPGKNEINLGFRIEAKLISPSVEKPAVAEKVSVEVRKSASRPEATMAVGYKVLGDAKKDLHQSGLQNLIRDINRTADITVNLEANIPLDKNLNRFTALYLTGSNRFELTEEQRDALNSFVQSGGVIFGEGCSEGSPETGLKGSKEFGLAFNQLASQLNCKLEVVQRHHPLLSVIHVFSEIPQGAEPAMLLEGKKIIYSGSDYGCAWQGGPQERPLSRDIIRGSLEMGVNIIAHARRTKEAER